MDRPHLFAQLEQHAAVIRALLTDLGTDEATWRPAADKWCALEVACHLLDEEREDFRAGLGSTWAGPGGAWPKMAPPAGVAERG